MGPLIQVFKIFSRASVPNRQAGSQPDHCGSQKEVDGASIHDVGERANLTSAKTQMTALRRMIRAAGLRDELSFTSFRHGGFTETGDAGLTDREIMAQGRHRSVKVLPRYVKRTTDQVAAGAQKRRASRTKSDQSSE